MKNKLNFVYRFEAGLIHNFTKERSLHSNDRFFLNSTHCFNFLGHLNSPNEEVDPTKFQEGEKQKVGQRRVLLGDDLGVETYAHLLARLDFTDVPYLKKYGLKPFVFGEFIFYPPASSNSLGIKSQLQ